LLGWGIFWLAWYSIQLRLHSPLAIIERINVLPRGVSKIDSREQLDKLWRLLSFTQRYVLRDGKPCLRRSLVLYRWSIRRDLPAGIAIGLRRIPDGITGHAWLLLEGAPYRENEAYLRQLTCFVRE
jgi:hypothetical protein